MRITKIQMLIIIIILGLIIWLSNYSKNAYDKCMVENNNNAGLCSTLIK